MDESTTLTVAESTTPTVAGIAGRPDDDDSDYVADMREAYQGRMEEVYEEWSTMEAEDRERTERELREAVERGEMFDAEWFASHESVPLPQRLARQVHVKGCKFCATYSVSDGLGKWLAHMAGQPYHEFQASGLRVVSNTAAFLDAEGRRSLGMYSLLGDAAATYAVVDRCFKKEYTKSRASEARTKCTAWTAMAKVFVSGVPKGFVQFPADVDPGTTRAGGEALEALLGIVSLELGVPSAIEFALAVGLFKSYNFKSTNS